MVSKRRKDKETCNCFLLEYSMSIELTVKEEENGKYVLVLSTPDRIHVSSKGTSSEHPKTDLKIALRRFKMCFPVLHVMNHTVYYRHGIAKMQWFTKVSQTPPFRVMKS